MTIVIRIVATALAFASFFDAQAQLPQYHAQVFGAEQGIGGGGIADIFKDRQQFLWIVNTSSLQRFDGRNVRTYSFEHSIRQAICDDNNRIWALSGATIWRSREASEGFERVQFDTAGGVSPVAVFQLPGRPVCILTGKGLFACDAGSKNFVRLPLSPPPPLPYTNLWRFDTCGSTIFYPGKDSLYAFDLGTGKARALPLRTEIPYLCALTPDLAIVSNYGSRSYWCNFSKDSVQLIEPRRYGLSGNSAVFGVTGATPLGKGRFLVTTRRGVFVYDLSRDRFDKEQIYAAGKPIETEDMLVRVSTDSHDAFWAHDVDAIVTFNSLENTIGLLRNYHRESPLAWSNRVVGFAEDDRGNIWFGGAGGFKKLDPHTGTITPYPAEDGATDRLSHPSVRGMGFDGRYVVLGPTNLGVWLFDPRSGVYRRPAYASDSVRRSSEGDFIDHLAILRNGDIVVAGRFHPYRIEAKTYRMDFIRFPGDDDNMNAVFQDKKGQIWLGGMSRLFRLDENYRLQSVHPVDPVFCLLEGVRDGELLIGTSEGLRRLLLRPEGAAVEKVPTPLEGVGITSLLRDQLQRFWMGSLGGLFLADTRLGLFKQFDFADNIQGLVFNGSACLKASNGMAFFGGINGINYFFPEKISMNDRPLSVSIQSLRINDRDTVQWWQPAALPDLPYHQNTLTFEVVAPYYNNAGKVQYRYRLSGNSEQWVHIGVNNQVRLANLPPGEYRLEVAASIGGQVWYGSAASLHFNILPPFWQTWPFRLAALSVIIGLIFSIIRYRENRLKKQQLAQLELERKAAEAKLQSMRLQMNPHFLFNALNSIQQMILSGNSDGAAMYLSKFSKLLRMVLTHSDHEQVSLREEIAMLRLYLDLESLRFDDTFTYAINSAADLDLDEYKVPPLLIQPFVENAIWHGLLHKEGARILHIHFESAPDDRLLCTIEDNGIGRAAAQAHSRNGAHTGTAVRVGNERIETLNRRYGQHNALEIVDLRDENNQPAGTRVHITLS
ncbi:MAG: hypothetical protein EPGJADBJ_03527 [Saprospiraceae bacterium]|nr:hypothetical protein [Saprospiraceae bacterium]